MEDKTRQAVTASKKEGEGDCDHSRRTFLKLFSAGGAMALVSPEAARAAKAVVASPKAEPMGVLVDTTLCIGCRQCEGACNDVNKLPPPKRSFDDDSVLNEHRDTSPREWSVVNRYKLKNGVQITRKQQCMNCVEPACSSACIIRALEKQPDGAVTWREDLCLGCRYCMVACPYDMPKFEYSKAVPRIRKCQFCFARQEKGQLPGCVEACPVEALKFGPRSGLIEEARKRIQGNPKGYIDHIYGEHEAGGASWLYLANAPFDELGLPKLAAQDYPELTAGAAGTVPAVLLIWPALLAGFHYFTDRKDDGQKEHGRHDDSHGGNR
ncbi:MAG: 4Fe-4S dicluster domain-containing protein [Syntrophobacteraceae bacterium]|nr:4Fe-4S dicluster domain-containing protein [Syntrophobacteraceae bacterium]